MGFGPSFTFIATNAGQWAWRHPVAFGWCYWCRCQSRYYVRVGIIDYGFKDFSTRLPGFANSVDLLHPFCYNKAGTVDETSISACETNIGNPPYDYHGTLVAEAISVIAPDVSLYVSNANTSYKVERAVNWMIEKKVDIINFSGFSTWDGSGDGTSPFNDVNDSRYSLLNSLNDAVSNGILWVGAAGNEANAIWFKRGITLSSARYVDFDTRANTQWCNNITQRLQSGKTYTFHIRWEGNWGNEDSDFTLHLYRTDPQPGWAKHQSYVQNGGAMQFPQEVMNYTPSVSGQYCLAITLAANDNLPAWLQLRAASLNLQYGDGSGSIMNPAESNNAGMLAVGAASLAPTPTIRADSSRGPAPEPGPNGRIKPDIVGGSASASAGGTSIATAHISGMAALVIQKLGHLSAYDTPAEVASYLKANSPIQPGASNPNNTWGWGFAKLPAPPPPTGLALRLDSSNPDSLLLDFTRSSWDASSNHRYHFALERFDSAKSKWVPFASSARVTASPVRFSGLQQGYWYRAKGKRCVVATAVSCGDWSITPYTQRRLPICGQPQNFDLASFNRSTREAVYRWDAPSGGGLTVTGYRTEWRETTGGTASKWSSRAILAASVRRQEVGPFALSHVGGKTYQNRVYAVCGTAQSLPSDHITLFYPITSPAPTATPRPAPTATPRPAPTATPRPAPTATPRPAPTATPRPAPTPDWTQHWRQYCGRHNALYDANSHRCFCRTGSSWDAANSRCTTPP